MGTFCVSASRTLPRSQAPRRLREVLVSCRRHVDAGLQPAFYAAFMVRHRTAHGGFSRLGSTTGAHSPRRLFAVYDILVLGLGCIGVLLMLPYGALCDRI